MAGGAGPELPPPGPTRDGPPWERERSIGTLFETWKGVLLEPTRTFGEASQTAGIGWALVYWGIFATIGTTFALFWSIVTNSLWASMALQSANELPPELQRFVEQFGGAAGGSTVFYIFALPLYLVMGLVSLFLMTALIHLFLLMIGGANRGFEATFRVIAYAGGSAALFYVFPFCGGLVSTVWAIVVEILGLSMIHETSSGKAAFAVLAPILLCCGCCIAFFLFLFSMALLPGMR